MKKMFVLATLVAFAAPVFAGGQVESPKDVKGPASHQEMAAQQKAQFEARKAEMKAKHEKMKATEEKLEKLVKEYKKAKAGSKKQLAAKAEIEQLLGEVRDEQIAQRAQGLENFEKRLADMKAKLAEEQQPKAKAEWLERTTAQVIEADGKLSQVFGRPGMEGGPKGMKAHKGHFGKRPPFKGGPKGDFNGGPKGPGVRGPADDILPMPPAPAEEK